MPDIVTYTRARADLGAALVEHPMNQPGFIGTKVLPVFGTQKKEASIAVITRESILRGRNVDRAPNSAYSRDTFQVDELVYACKERGHEQPLDDGMRSQFKLDFDVELTAAQMAYDVVLREQEKRIASAVFNTTTWTGSDLYTDVATAWSNAAADIIGNVDAGKDKVRTNSGVEANTLILSRANLANIKANTAIKDAIKYTVGATEENILQSLAALFGLQQVVIAGAVYNSGKENAAYAGANIWSSSYAMVCTCAMSANPLEPCIGRTLLWTADTPENATVEDYYEPQTRSMIYRVRQFTDEKIFDASFGHLLKID